MSAEIIKMEPQKKQIKINGVVVEQPEVARFVEAMLKVQKHDRAMDEYYGEMVTLKRFKEMDTYYQNALKNVNRDYLRLERLKNKYHARWRLLTRDRKIDKLDAYMDFAGKMRKLYDAVNPPAKYRPVIRRAVIALKKRVRKI